MKSGIEDIIGKQICGVMVKARPEGQYPRMQVFLMFDDESYYELYGHDCEIQGTSGVSMGGVDSVRKLTGDSAVIVLEKSLL